MSRVNKNLWGMIVFLVLVLGFQPVLAAQEGTPQLSNGQDYGVPADQAGAVSCGAAEGGGIGGGEGDPNELGDGWDLYSGMLDDFQGYQGSEVADEVTFEQYLVYLLFQLWALP